MHYKSRTKRPGLPVLACCKDLLYDVHAIDRIRFNGWSMSVSCAVCISMSFQVALAACLNNLVTYEVEFLISGSFFVLIMMLVMYLILAIAGGLHHARLNPSRVR
jgi:hypothetical protein